MKGFLIGLSDLNFGTGRTWLRVSGMIGPVSDITVILDLILFKGDSITSLKTFAFILPFFTV